MITLKQVDRVADLIDLTSALQEEHWDEIARNKHLMVLAPDIDKYRAIEQTGKLFAVLAYDGDEMVGYSVNILDNNLHYRDLIQAQNDVLFVKQSYRAGRLFMRLRDATLAMARERGVQLMLWHAKEQTPLAAILPRLGCKVQDVIYSEEVAPSHFRMFGSLDVSAGAHEALATAHASDLWDQFIARQAAPGSAHHDTRTIVLRGPDVADGTLYTSDVVYGMLECRDWQSNIDLMPEAAALCAAACHRLGVTELGRVMLVELAPGGHIDRHVDEGAYAEYYDRFHLVLDSDEGNTFTNGDETIHMKPGELWRFDHRTEHEVSNASARPRIHLIIDAITK